MNFWDSLEEELTVTLEEPFDILFQQQPILYLEWEPDLPSCVEVVDKKVNLKSLIDEVTATFVCHEAGDHTLTFLYRKQCCDRRVISTRTYHIHAVEK
ncbi:MAG: hypothetical protein ACRDDX_03080 [Cellulosilyticaceae bacterium]